MSYASLKNPHLSRQGFHRLHENMPSYAPNTSDATTEIPLENVATTNDHDHIQTYGPLKTTMSEKSATGSMRQRTFGHRVKQTASNERATVARNKEGELVTLNTMGKVYRRILDFSIITRYFLYVLPLGLAIAVPIVVGATASKDAKIGGVRIVWFFTWVEIGMHDSPPSHTHND